MTTPIIWVKVNDEVVDNLWRAMEGVSQRRIASELARAAMFHITMVEKNIPEVMREKIEVAINDVGDNFVIRYQPKAGTEAPTVTHETVFIPTISTKTAIGEVKEPEPWHPEMAGTNSGAEGYFFAGLKVGGRPSLESHIMRTIEMVLPEANDATADFAAVKIKEELKIWFEQNGIRFNEAAGRWIAPAGGITLPWGGFISGGQFIVGEF
jgi:hypothetical protein